MYPYNWLYTLLNKWYELQDSDSFYFLVPLALNRNIQLIRKKNRRLNNKKKMFGYRDTKKHKIFQHQTTAFLQKNYKSVFTYQTLLRNSHWELCLLYPKKAIKFSIQGNQFKTHNKTAIWCNLVVLLLIFLFYFHLY